MQKKIEKRNKKLKEEEDQRTKAHRRVLAKIAYKDWKQTKQEEYKLKAKQEMIERRQGMYNQQQKGMRRVGSESSSRYINTEHKRNQVSICGGSISN